MRTTILSACLLLAALSSAPTAQVKFDYITFDKIRLDPNYALATSTRWGIIVNTGTVPISLDNDWEAGLCYAETSQLLGNFFYEPLNPFGNDKILEPGHAIGDADPLLLAELLPGETFDGAALIAHFQFGIPFPTSDFEIDVMAQMGDQIVKTQTVVELADLGGNDFWVPVTAKRVTCELSSVSYQSYGSPCAAGGGGATLTPRGFNGGPGGPPWVAYRSSMPQLGNWAFGMEINSPVFNPEFFLALDVAPGNFSFLDCQVLLGVTPALTIQVGVINNFQKTINVPLPASPGLAGLTVYFQGAVIKGGLLRTTNGIAVVLGDVLP